MSSRFLLIVPIVCLGLLMQCSGTGKTGTGLFNKETHLVKSDSGKTIRIKSGEGFEISLGECIGCAEVWQIANSDEEKIAFISNTYSGNNCKTCDGGYQVNSFHFKVLKPGTSTVSLTYFKEKFSVTIEGY